MRPEVFVAHPIPEIGIDMLRARYEVTVHPDSRPLAPEDLIRALTGCAAAVTLLCDRIDEAILSAVPDLKVIANYAVGYDNIDVEAARRAGVKVTHTPGVLTAATAEIAFALLITLTRRIREAERFTREGRFTGWDPLLLRGDELAGRTLGIIGMGRIGRDMAAKCQAFGMRILYHNRRPVSGDVEKALCATYVRLDELFETADVISLHAPATPETRHIIDAAAFSRMKPGAYLINTARGDLVDESALVEALDSGRIKGAGLDVYEREPEITAALFRFDNVVLLPHIGSATVEARDKMAVMAARNVRAVLEGLPPENPVPELAGLG